MTYLDAGHCGPVKPVPGAKNLNPVAQLAEQAALNRQVVGSLPTGVTCDTMVCMANIVQYIIANQGANMSGGKLAAQVAHAAVKGYAITRVQGGDYIEVWNKTGHTKIVLMARDNEHMYAAERYLADQGIATALIIDEGRTEVPALTPTALGSELVDKDDERIKFAFGTFKLYKDKPKQAVPPTTRKSWRKAFRGLKPSS